MSWLEYHVYDNEVVFAVLFTVIALVNLAGNGLVIFVVKRFLFMRTPMNYLLVHLAVCDILVGIFLSLSRFVKVHYVHGSQLEGDLLCKFGAFDNIVWLASATNVCTLVVIAWERYNAIMKPHAPRFSNKKLKVAIGICWVASITVNLFLKVFTIYNPSRKECELEFQWVEKADSVIWFTFVGLVPNLVMVALYGRVICTLWSSSHNDSNVAQRSLLKSRKRITKSGITVTVFLVFCWMPNLIYYLVVSHSGNPFHYVPPHSSTVFWRRVTHIFLLLNSTINPFIYELPDERFRRCLRNIFKCRMQARDHRVHPEGNAVVHNADIAEKQTCAKRQQETLKELDVT